MISEEKIRMQERPSIWWEPGWEDADSDADAEGDRDEIEFIAYDELPFN